MADDQPQEPAPQPSGWGGWSSWLTTAYDYTAQQVSNVEAYVAPVMDVAFEKTSSFVTSVEDAFFLPEDASSNPDTPLHSSVESPPQSDRLSMEPVEAKEGEGWEVIYDDEQEGVSIASSLNYLNNFISTTANTLYNTEVSGLARDLMSTSIEKSKQVYNQVVDMDTTALADSGLGALEKIGEKAMGMFSRTRQDEVKVISDATLEYNNQFVEEFDKLQGTAHMQALESISIDCMMNTQQTYRKLTDEQREQVDDQFVQNQTIFNADHTSHALDLTLNPKYEALLVALRDTETAVIKAAAVKEEQFLASLTALESDIGKQEWAGLVVSFQAKFQSEAVHDLAQLCALAVEIMTEAARHFFETKDDVKVTAKATYLAILVDQLSHAIATVTSQRTATAAKLETLYTTHLSEDRAVHDFVAKVEHSKQVIVLASGSAIANIQESAKFFLSLCKYLSTAS